jgi:hypothetical protein
MVAWLVFVIGDATLGGAGAILLEWRGRANPHRRCGGGLPSGMLEVVGHLEHASGGTGCLLY